MAEKIDLNSASKEELMNISEIGDDCADFIVTERERRAHALENLREQARV